MYSSPGFLVLGFHGCDKAVAEAVIAGKTKLHPSKNSYDWLGHGIYFWENSPERALDFAKQSMKRPGSEIKEPFALGAIINLGHCLNLLSARYLGVVKKGYRLLKELLEAAQVDMPVNEDPKGSRDMVFRHRDCAVIQMVHTNNEESGEALYDSVRGAFWEGSELYPGAGFRDKDHIQICIRNPNCIKGYFRPLGEVKDRPLTQIT